LQSVIDDLKNKKNDLEKKLVEENFSKGAHEKEV